MTRTDASPNEYMNNLRQRRNRQAGSLETSGTLAARPDFNGARCGGRGCSRNKEKGRPLREIKKAGRGHPERLVSRLINGRLEIASHLQTESTAEENEVLSTIPTTKLMVETLELQSRALVASRTVIEELERVTTVTVPRLKKEVAEANQASKASAGWSRSRKANWRRSGRP
ncbi:hypothetical protein ACSQ67_003690 [Phaseolus vulgaris]